MDYYFSEKGFEVCRIDGSVKLEERKRQVSLDPFSLKKIWSWFLWLFVLDFGIGYIPHFHTMEKFDILNGLDFIFTHFFSDYTVASKHIS